MRIRLIARAALILSLMSFGFAAASRAEPLLTQGIGTQNCGKLAGDLRPSEGLNHPPNYLLLHRVIEWVDFSPIFESPVAVVVIAVGMWATRLRCPSCPQRFPLVWT